MTKAKEVATQEPLPIAVAAPPPELEVLPAETAIAKIDPQAKAELSEMSLLDKALEHNAGIDIIERLSALREKAINRAAEVEFNRAMSAVQAEIGRVAPDLSNSQTSSKYASYAALDRVLRPIYTRHGFALSFDEADSPRPDCVRVVCYVTHIAGYTRTYHKDMPPPIKGPKGNAVMSETHGAAAADSYGMRYILRKIFNVAIGEDDTDGNAEDLPGIQEHLKNIAEACAVPVLREHFGRAFREAKLAKNLRAEQALTTAYHKRKEELAAQEVEPA